MNYALGFGLAFVVGAGSRYLNIPCPAPQALSGALLVMAITLGYMAMEYFLK